MRNGRRKSGARGVARFVPLTVACLAGAAMLGVGIMSADAQLPGKRALILGSSVEGGASSLEAQAVTANGFTVEVASDADWAAKSATDFAGYQLIVIGDPSCGSLPQVATTNAQALADAVMGRAGGKHAGWESHPDRHGSGAALPRAEARQEAENSSTPASRTRGRNLVRPGST